MKTLILSFVLSLFFISLSAQDFELPQDFDPKNKAEYAKYEPTLIQAIDWLQETPLSSQTDKRKETSGFVMVWLSGSPDVDIHIKPRIIDFAICQACLVTFVGGWAKYSLETKNKEELTGTIAGIESVIKFYAKNRAHLPKINSIEKYTKLKEKGKLEKFIQSKI